MPGHMGDVSRTTQNLTVVKILTEKNLILVKGSVPGHKGSIITLRVAKKSKNPHKPSIMKFKLFKADGTSSEERDVPPIFLPWRTAKEKMLFAKL